MPAMFHCRRGLVVLVAACAAVLGCRPAEETHSYTVAREAAPGPSATATAPTDRMLAAILPTGQQAWFFKVVGPTAAVDPRASEVLDFFSSIRLADGQRPQWTLPGGWTEQEGAGMRAATIMIPGGGEPLELTVIGLPWTGDPAELLSNVNRWRGQMKLAPVEAGGLAECTRDVKVGDVTMTVVDLRGQFKSSGMSAPFAGGGDPFHGVSPPGGGSMDTSSAGLPAGHPPVGSSGGEPTPVPQFTAPESWHPLPAGGIRKAAFQIAEGDQEAVVTVIDFPATEGPAIADPFANVNRWRSEVGLDPITEDHLSDAVETLDVDGQQATYVAALPDAASDQQSGMDRGTVAAMVTHGDRVWFFKLTGARDLVAAQQDQFRSFLESVRFAANGGASDGN